MSVPVDEGLRMVRLLAGDCTSRTGAAAAGMTFAPSREWLLLADLYDAFAAVHFKRPKPYPRPWRAENTERIGATGGRSRDEVLKILRPNGPYVAKEAG